MNIFETVSAVMKDIGAIGKTSKNTTQGFMFRGIDAVMNAINPALVKYKLFIVPEVLEQTREERQTTKGGTLIYSIVKVKYTFYAEDGTSITATVIGEGMDSGDKATNKAMSIAFKYACFQVFCIPTEEMVDPDKESHEVTQKTISAKDASTLNMVLTEKNVNIEKMLEMYKVTALTDLTPAQYSDILNKVNGNKSKS
jgi:hypothetical protein